MGAVRYRFGAELRTRCWAWLALAVIVGVVAGTVMVLAAGARRTSTAHDRFRKEQRAYALIVACVGTDGTAERGATCSADVARLRAVTAVTVGTVLPAFVEADDGRSLQPDPNDPCYSGPGVVQVVADTSGRLGTDINTYRYLDGRPADPASMDEVVISRETARRLNLGPGSALQLRLFDGVDCLADPAAWRPPITVRVVGVQLSPGEVVTPWGDYSQSVTVTAAFVAAAG